MIAGQTKAPKAGTKPQSQRSIRRLAINTFLIFHILAIACWAIPLRLPIVYSARALIRPYFIFIGLFQSWDMFSPIPKNANVYVEAIIIYQDGNTRTWAFPRVEHLSLAERYSKERYRKYIDNLKDDNYSALWPDAARYVARLNNTRSSPVKMVLFVRYWSAIIRQRDGTFSSDPWNEHIFYSYRVAPGDLTS